MLSAIENILENDYPFEDDLPNTFPAAYSKTLEFAHHGLPIINAVKEFCSKWRENPTEENKGLVLTIIPSIEDYRDQIQVQGDQYKSLSKANSLHRKAAALSKKIAYLSEFMTYYKHDWEDIISVLEAWIEKDYPFDLPFDPLKWKCTWLEHELENLTEMIHKFAPNPAIKDLL